MNKWVWSGETALIAGSILFFVLFLPVVIWQFRRYGDWNGKRMLGSAAVCLYLTAIVTYTWLPLPPNSAEWCSQYAVKGIQTQPFSFVGDILQALKTHRQVAFTILQTLFNVVLFLPWGILARGYFHMKWWQATLTGMAASLFIEATQYTGLWFVYPCAYRFADIDDVITNTAGALLGALIAPLTLFWMPKAQQLQATKMKPRRLTWRRSVAANLINITLYLLLTFVFAVVYIGVRTVLTDVKLSAPLDMVGGFVVYGGAFFLVFVSTTIHGGPAGSGSVGENCVWLTPAWRNKAGEITDGNLFLRVLRESWFMLPTVITAAIGSGSLAFKVFPVLVLIAFALFFWKRIHKPSHDRFVGFEADIRDPEIQKLARD